MVEIENCFFQLSISTIHYYCIWCNNLSIGPISIRWLDSIICNLFLWSRYMFVCEFLHTIGPNWKKKKKKKARDHVHVVMLPWSAFGHLIPFFQLSIALAKSGIHVSFVSTPRNIQRLPKVPPSLATLITLVEFSLPKLDNDLLPEGSEATVDVPVDKVEYLKLAYDRLQ